MIIDCHGHYTTAPKALRDYREQQIAALTAPTQPALAPNLKVSDDEVRETIEKNQLRIQRERGVDMTIFSPQAGGMAHHIGNETTSKHWTQACNDMIHRVCTLYPNNFTGVCQLPQSPGVNPANCVAELKRCVQELGFIGCNVNPDPSDGNWTGPPLTDKSWYPLYEAMVELDVPAMVHVSMSCNPNFHGTGAHYINGDTTAFMQLIQADLFKDFPTLRMIIAQDMQRPPLAEMLKNVYFDTCVYHQPGIDLLLKVIPHDNVLFASEIVGAVKGIDPETGHYFDDTKRYIESADVAAASRDKIFSGNALKVYPRLKQLLK